MLDHPSGPEEVADLLVKAVRAGVDVLPVPTLPTPPRPGGRSGRTRQRHARALALCAAANRTISILNLLATTTVPVRENPAEVPVARRILPSDAGRVTSTWLHILREVQRVQHARRESVRQAPTGDLLVKKLAEAGSEDHTYHDVGARPSPYVPFISCNIVEPALGHATVSLQSALPREVLEK